MRAGATSSRVHPGLRGVVAAAGLTALTTRQVGWDATAIIIAVGAAAVLMPHDHPITARTDPLRWISVAFLGALSFAAVRGLIPTLVLPATATVVVTGSIAAVAEEAFFRKFLYGWLSRWGPAVAIVGSALAFAAVHLPLYGVAAFPIDLGAGLLFGWQRWATGSWTAPAATHVIANLLTLG
ncbi:MAG TPA: CPBP family intramembrane glutamic endopeptidase [Actinomycetota bacterium]|nr:CPBP family intramembrane glutamic endopeptidase [Actinomycetota bacterium]